MLAIVGGHPVKRRPLARRRQGPYGLVNPPLNQNNNSCSIVLIARRQGGCSIRCCIASHFGSSGRPYQSCVVASWLVFSNGRGPFMNSGGYSALLACAAPSGAVVGIALPVFRALIADLRRGIVRQCAWFDDHATRCGDRRVRGLWRTCSSRRLPSRRATYFSKCSRARGVLSSPEPVLLELRRQFGVTAMSAIPRSRVGRVAWRGAERPCLSAEALLIKASADAQAAARLEAVGADLESRRRSARRPPETGVLPPFR